MERWERLNKQPGTDIPTTSSGVSVEFKSESEAIKYAKGINT